MPWWSLKGRLPVGNPCVIGTQNVTSVYVYTSKFLGIRGRCLFVRLAAGQSAQSKTPNRYFYEGAIKVLESGIDGSKGANLRMKTVIKRPPCVCIWNPFAVRASPYFANGGR